MKVLRFTNIPTPDVAEHLGFPKLMSGHWMSELLSALKDTERIHYAHMGMGLDDVALAWAVYQMARERNLGILLPLWREPLWV